MNATDALAWLHRLSDMTEEQQRPCQRGHVQCSITDGGECLEDVLQAAFGLDQPTTKEKTHG